MSEAEEWGHRVGWRHGAGEDKVQGLGTCGAGAGRLVTESMGTARGKRDTSHRAPEWDMEVMGLGEWAPQGQGQQGQGWWKGNGAEARNRGAEERGLV